MGKWAICADWYSASGMFPGTFRQERAWWIVDDNYPEGALSQGLVKPAVFQSKAAAVQEAVAVALKVSGWSGAYDVGVQNVTGKLSPLGYLIGKIGDDT